MANEALALARQVGAPALVATSLLALGAAVVDTDPGQARACLRESSELSAALGYQSAINLNWAFAIAFAVGDHAAALELAVRAIRGLRWSGDRVRMGLVLHTISSLLAASRPDAAAIIQGVTQAHAVGSVERVKRIAQLRSQLAATLGEERARELGARGADMDWDQAIAYALTQTTQALSELEPQTRP